MIDLMQRLAELDAKNPNVVKEGLSDIGMTDEAAAKKIAEKLMGTPNINRGNIDQHVSRYLGMVGKNPTDLKYLSALVMSELEDSGMNEEQNDDDDRSGADLVHVPMDKVAEFEDWMKSEGLETDVPKQQQGSVVVYDYSNADHISKMYADEWNDRDSPSLAEAEWKRKYFDNGFGAASDERNRQKTLTRHPEGTGSTSSKTMAKLMRIPGFAKIPSAEQERVAKAVDGYLARDLSFDQALVLAQKKGMSEGFTDCGMAGGMSQPHSPATINMTADSGEELSAMLKDILSLAGMTQVEPEHLGVEPMPAVVTAEPGVSVADPDGHSSIMRAMMDKLNPEADDELDSYPDNEKKMNEYDNTGADPHDHDMADDAMVRPSNQDPAGAPGAAVGRHLKNNPVATPMPMSTYESLMSDYKQFVLEGAKEAHDAHEKNMDAAQREMDSREAEGEDMSNYVIDPKTYKIVKKK